MEIDICHNVGLRISLIGQLDKIIYRDTMKVVFAMFTRQTFNVALTVHVK